MRSCQAVKCAEAALHHCAAHSSPICRPGDQDVRAACQRLQKPAALKGACAGHTGSVLCWTRSAATSRCCTGQPCCTPMLVHPTAPPGACICSALTSLFTALHASGHSGLACTNARAQLGGGGNRHRGHRAVACVHSWQQWHESAERAQHVPWPGCSDDSQSPHWHRQPTDPRRQSLLLQSSSSARAVT